MDAQTANCEAIWVLEESITVPFFCLARGWGFSRRQKGRKGYTHQHADTCRSFSTFSHFLPCVRRLVQHWSLPSLSAKRFKGFSVIFWPIFTENFNKTHFWHVVRFKGLHEKEVEQDGDWQLSNTSDVRSFESKSQVRQTCSETISYF